MSKKKSVIANASSGLKATLSERSRKRRSRHQSLREMGENRSAARNDLLPDLSVSYVPIDQLVPARRRLRRDDPVQVERIKASILRFGICRPILVDGERRIIDGHSTFSAAQAVGLSTVPAISVGHLGESEVRLLSIALNRIGETGQWDEDALKLEFEELIDLGEDVVVSGFNKAEIDLLLIEEEDDSLDALDDLPSASDCAISRPGDLWLLGGHRLLQGNSLEPATYSL